MLHLKYHGIFIIMADEKINKGVHPPQKIMKENKKLIEMENIYTICRIFFFIFQIFLLGFTLIFFSDRPDFVFHNKIHRICLGANGISVLDTAKIGLTMEWTYLSTTEMIHPG